MKFYKCNLCGQVITKVTDTNVNVVCCGQPMKEIVPKEDEEGLTEKHVPYYVCNEDGIIIRIGETAHPMTKEHYIEWILIETNKGYLQRKLKPGDQPIANFTLDEDEKIKNISYVKSLKDLVIAIYRYYEANAEFVDASLNSAGKDLFQEFIYNNCYTTILKLVNETKDNKRILSNDRKSIARFFALAYAHSIVYYLSVFKSKSLEGLLDSFCFIKDSDLQKAVANYIEYKGMPNDRF